jgi:hypothetical protein
VTIPVAGSVAVQPVTTTTIHRFFPQRSTTTVGVDEPTTTVAGPVTIAVTSTSTPAVTTVDSTTTVTIVQQLVAPTTTTFRAGLLRPVDIGPNQSKSPGGVGQIFFVIIGAMIMGVAVFVILAERDLRR